MDNKANMNTKGAITKTFSSCYLYNKASNVYEKDLVDFIIKGQPINKADPTFENVLYDVKRRQICQALYIICKSEDLVIMNHNVRMPKAFSVFTAKDLKDNNRTKVFMYNDSIEHNDNNSDYKLSPRNVDVFLAHLLEAMTQVIYYSNPKRILLDNTITVDGMDIFSRLFTNIIDYIFKISVIGNQKNKVLYLSSLYYVANILHKDINDTNRNRALKLSGLSAREEKLLLLEFDENKGYVDIRYFIQEISKVLKLDKLTLELFVEKWIWIYGTGTQFALELFPSFAAMITNAFMGCYLNNQKAIEKIIGPNLLNSFGQALIRIGKGVFE